MVPAMLGLAVAGTAVSAISAIRQGQVQGDTAQANARLQAREMYQQALMAEREAQSADYAAQAEREPTAYDVARHREASTAFQAEQRVQVGGSGLEATGSPLLVMQESARQLELDRLALEHAGETRARAAEDEARLLRYQAEQLRKGVPLTLGMGRYASRAARQAGALGATRSILSGGANIGSITYGAYG